MPDPSQASDFLKEQKGLSNPKEPLLVSKSVFKRRLVVILPGLVLYFALRFLEIDFLLAVFVAFLVSAAIAVMEYTK